MAFFPNSIIPYIFLLKHSIERSTPLIYLLIYYRQGHMILYFIQWVIGHYRCLFGVRFSEGSCGSAFQLPPLAL